MTEFAWFVFSAGGAVCALGLGGVWLWARPSSRTAGRVVIAATMFYALASTYGLSHQVTRILGAGFDPLAREDVPQGTTAVVLLGSGSVTARDWEGNRFSTVDSWAASRVLETARVFALADPAWVISSGGLVEPGEGNVSTGVIMRDALIQLGIPAARILSDTRSRDTRAEAVAIAALLRSLQARHTILVTSRAHMRRSIGAFRAQGVTVIPAVAHDPDARIPWIKQLLPSEEGLYEAAIGAHELLGLGYYTLRGWYRR